MIKIGEKNKGITLIALVITIIILLILAGITIATLSNTELFEKSKQAKEENIKAQLKEEISFAIQEIQIEEEPKENNVTLETLANGQLTNKLKDITAELGTNEITGEYKNYEYTIDSKLEVKIEEKVSETGITGRAEIQTGYVFDGNTIDIKVTANITEGTISKIEAPSGATLKKEISTAEKIYTVDKNGIYIFKIIGDKGKTKNLTVDVEKILEIPQIKINEIKENTFKINVENNYPEGVITEYKYYVEGEVKQQGTAEKSYTVEGLKEDTKYNNIKVIAYINGDSRESNIEVVTTDIKGGIIYSWDEIAEIAKEIAKSDTITSDTETAIVTVNGQQKTLKVGDCKKLDGKKVRILGFNHDTLSDANAYGTTVAKGTAGISFEYIDFITDYLPMNSTDTNIGGWGATELRKKLNESIYNSLSIKNDIKKVEKEYIETFNDPESKKTSEDYLWLLSCGEIWDNGYNGGKTRGYAVETEGSQYKYYKINLQSTGYTTNSNITKKPNINAGNYWWLRSPYYSPNTGFCDVNPTLGICYPHAASNNIGVAPGFSI